MNREEFEREFNSRTIAYHPEFRSDDRPVVVAFGESADSPPAHLLAVALVNQLARAHRRIILVGELDQPLRCADHFGFGTLEAATVGLARAINPFIEVSSERRRPTEESLITLGLGTDGDLRLGCEGWLAVVGPGAEIHGGVTSLLGASLASCLGATTAFHTLLGSSEHPAGPFSLWDYGAAGTRQGPDVDGPVDVGRVLQVGAGAVGCALDYWLGFLGYRGSWVIVDGDLVEVSNLNRQLLFLAGYAGFGPANASPKAQVVSELLGGGAQAAPGWYGEDGAVIDATYDLVLPLANERGVRPALQSRAQTVLLHATTTPSWTAIAHRHVAGRDGCIVCRLPEEEDPVFTCSTAAVGGGQRMDASLPFLSGVAGLILLRDVIALEKGRLLDRETNFASLDLRTPIPFVRQLRWPCREGCRVQMPADSRLRRTAGCRFAHLDGERRID